MTLDLAKGSLGRGVVWRSGTSEERTGIITFTGGESAFVQFAGDHFSKATNPADLTLIAAKVPGDE